MNLKSFLYKSQEIFGETLSHRRYLHQNPELSFREFNTTRYISEFLASLNINHKIALKSSSDAISNDIGVVAWIGEGNQSIALRADIDALPIIEETNLPFCSQNESIMHACGHDLHTAMLLSAAKILKEIENELNHKVVLIFQPGEEQLPGGAKLILESGILNEFNIKAFFGQHINPELPVGYISTKDGPLMASTDEIHINIKGKSTHAAQPHLGADPILAGMNLITFLNSLPIKFSNPLEHVVVAITSFQSGNTTNVVPENAKMLGTIRTYNQKLRNELKDNISKISPNIVESMKCSLDLMILEGYPPLLNNPDATKYVQQIAFQILDSDKFIIAEPKMWAEDFAYYSQFAPSTFWFLGSGNPEKEFYPLHNPKFNPDENAMIVGTAMLAGVGF